MRLFRRKKQVDGTGKRQQIDKYLVNVRDKKYRRYLDEQFDDVVKKEDVIKLMEELQWVSIKRRIENMPTRLRFNVLRYMMQHVNELQPDVKQNFIRYMNERRGVEVGGKS